MKWQALSASDLHFRRWDEETVVYNALSGDVHLLAAEAATILAVLAREPAGLAALQTALAAPAEPPETVRQWLAELEALDLIEPCLP